MFDVTKSYGFDKEAANTGVKMIVGADDEDYILIKKMPNDDYQRELQKVSAANDKILTHLKLQNPEEHTKLDRRLQCQVMAKTVVIGWGKTFGENDKLIKYSADECARMLEEYPDFRYACSEFAQDKLNYPLVPDVKEIKKP